MKTLNCANCGANLKFEMGDQFSYCQFCDSVNVFENVEMSIDKTNLVDDTPTDFEELKPRIMMAQEKFISNYKESWFNSQGGQLWVSNIEIFFKPHKSNLGDLSKKFMKISDIVKMEKVNKKLGLSRELHITGKNGNIMELVSWNRDGIISSIEKIKNNLG